MTSRRQFAATPSRSVPAGSRRRSRKRTGAVLVFLLALFVAAAARLAQLQVVDGRRYTEIGESQRIRPVTLPAERGSVFDRNGAELALSVPQHTVWTDPRLVTNPAAEANALAPVLGIDANTLLRS